MDPTAAFAVANNHIWLGHHGKGERTDIGHRPRILTSLHPVNWMALHRRSREIIAVEACGHGVRGLAHDGDRVTISHGCSSYYLDAE